MIYSGVLAQHYDQLFPESTAASEVRLYASLINQHGTPALEVGSGTGRLLIPLLTQGHSIEGLEPSAEMTTLCLEKARMRELQPLIRKGSLPDVALPRIYRIIIVPSGTFQCVNRRDAPRALATLRSALVSEGVLVLAMADRPRLPPPDGIDQISVPNGGAITFREDSAWDLDQRVESIRLTCAVSDKVGRTTFESYSALVTYYGSDEMSSLLKAAGLRVVSHQPMPWDATGESSPMRLWVAQAT